MKRWKFWLIILAVWFAGVGIGSLDEPEVETRTIKDYVQVPGEPEQPTETITVVPESCLELAQDAKRLAGGAEAIDASSTKQLDIISNVRIAMAQQDVEALNILDEQQRKLQSRTLRGAQVIAETEPETDQALRECENEIE